PELPLGWECTLSSSPLSTRLFAPLSAAGPEAKPYQTPLSPQGRGSGRGAWTRDQGRALAFISRFTSRAWAINSAESASAPECQVAAGFSHPGGVPPNCLARVAH